MFSPSKEAYKITHTSCDVVTLEHRSESHLFHGREKTDHPEAAAMLASLPENLWSASLTDVGHCVHVTPVMFDIPDTTPIWQR